MEQQIKEYYASINKFIGMASESPTYLGDYGDFKVLKNFIPNYSSLVSAPDFCEVGDYGDLDISEWDTLSIMRIATNNQDIEAIRNPEISVSEGLAIIIRRKNGSDTKFLELKRGVWIENSPKDANGNLYNFKGTNFSTTTFQENLFLCSGEELFPATESYIDPINSTVQDCAIMTYDGLSWSGVFTGFTGFGVKVGQLALYLQAYETFKNTPYTSWTADQKLIADQIQPGYIVDDTVNNTIFNPNIIEFLQGRLLATGSNSNPLQVKVSQNRNPFNMASFALSAQFTPLTTSDNDRPSTFKLPAGSSRITGMYPDGKKMRISTLEEMYNYTLVDFKTSTGSLFSFDNIAEDTGTFSTIHSNSSFIKTPRGLSYLSSSNIYKELGALEIKNTASGTATYLQYQKYSGKVNQVMKSLDFEEVSMGTYNENILASVGVFDTEYKNELGLEEDRITLVGSTFNLGQENIQRSVCLWDYVDISKMITIKENTYFVDSSTGKVNKFVTDYYKEKSMELITFDVGIDPRVSNNTYLHELTKIKIDGYFSKGTQIEITFHTRLGDGKVANIVANYTPDQIVTSDTVEGAYRNSAFVKIPSKIRYNDLRLTMKINNCRYCKIQSISLAYIIPPQLGTGELKSLEVVNRESCEEDSCQGGVIKSTNYREKKMNWLNN